MRYCSRPGCRREAAPDDTLCTRHRAGRNRSVAATRPLMAPSIGSAIRHATLSEVLQHMRDMELVVETNPAWWRLRQWLTEQSDGTP